jgi:hypothetical protein
MTVGGLTPLAIKGVKALAVPEKAPLTYEARGIAPAAVEEALGSKVAGTTNKTTKPATVVENNFYRDGSPNVGAKEGTRATVITPAMETKILHGERAVNASGTPTNRLTGAHGGEITNSNPNYAVEVLSVNADGTRNAKLLTQFSDGNVSNIKTSTLFPENWTPGQSIGAVKQVGDLVPVATRADGAALYQSTVNGVQIEVIKVGDNVTAGYPVGSRGFQTKNYFLTGKE